MKIQKKWIIINGKISLFFYEFKKRILYLQYLLLLIFLQNPLKCAKKKYKMYPLCNLSVYGNNLSVRYLLTSKLRKQREQNIR